MEKYPEIVKDIKQELDFEEESELVNNNHEAVIEELETEEETQEKLKVVEINLKKFDRKWKNKEKTIKIFETYFVCGMCDFVSKRSCSLNKHIRVCKIIKECKNCFSKSQSKITE